MNEQLNWTELELKNFSSILVFSQKLFVFILTYMVQQVNTTPCWLFVFKTQLYSVECRRIVIYYIKVAYDEMNKQYIILNANLGFPISTSHMTCLNLVYYNQYCCICSWEHSQKLLASMSGKLVFTGRCWNFNALVDINK